MDIFKQIVATFSASAILLGIFIFIVKKYIEKWISTEFDKRMMITKLEIDQQYKTHEFMLDQQLGIYPEIIEVTYRLRNILRDGISQDVAYKWDPSLRPLCAHLIENLYKYRLFISDEVFQKLHRFKQIVQDAIIFHDTYTSEERLFDTNLYSKDLDHIGKKVEEIDTLYEDIRKEIKMKLGRKSG